MPLDRDSWFFRTGRKAVINFTALFLVGLAASPLQKRSWGEVRTFQPELNLQDVESALGQGIVIGLLGGFRTLLADFVYLRANYYWEKYDRPNTEALLGLTSSIDPRPMYFWLNGARMIAYDIPVWRIREKGAWEDVPEFYRKEIYREQVDRAMKMLDRAEKFHPDDMRLPLEKARIYYDKVNDYEKAAENYKRAIDLPNAPYYAHRIYANALDKAGHPREAYNFLKNRWFTMDHTNRGAMPEVVLERIRELEARLDTPFIERLPPQPGETEEQFNLSPFGESTISRQGEVNFNIAPATPDPAPAHDHDHDHGHDHNHDH
ncbi:tetratricopeptide repeat protein [Cerasicoccus maritimus]|uniref:tetratricopeptide repeat protein n=1 Tax=Cerasicoccus maritimus TaxID=490089 RepID=UPI0028528A17|nr:hypothetical protein [Cerasicoccus maritimus]